MNKELQFPDYKPKLTPDTFQDYLKTPSFIYQVISEVGEPILENLKKILTNFIHYKKKAEQNPGEIRQGNVAIGANLNQYYPSEEELLVSELGKKLKIVVENHSEKDIERYKKVNKISVNKLSFNEIYFRHVDVMGSGRFFYAEKHPKKIELNL